MWKKKNHIINKNVKYIKGNTKDIDKILKKNVRKNSLNFSFWRIFQNLSKLFKYG